MSLSRTRSLTLVPGLALVSALLLSGCGGAAESTDATADATTDATATAAISVVAASNVYGGIAEVVGGEQVSVHSIISKAGADPHGYEANAQDKLAVSKADVGIENGGGYDDFFSQLSNGVLPAEDVVNVSELSGIDGGDHFNEHVWYSLPTMATLADELAARFTEADPAAAATFTANAAAFKESLTGLEDRLAALNTADGGAEVAVTEPVPLYLLEQAGLVNVTPHDFTEAVENGADASASVLAETVALAAGGDIRLLAYNTQTEGAQSLAVKAAADEAGVTVVDFSETLPEGLSYVEWMERNVTQLEEALRS